MTDGTNAPRMGLCLCGGGITGAMWEVGALAAFEQAFEGFRASQFDVYVGASSGATVATALSGGLPAQRLYRALLDPADDFFPLQRHHLLGLDQLELKRVAWSIMGAVRRSLTTATSRPLQIDLWHEIDRFYDSLPAGLFTIDAYEQFLSEFMGRRGIPKDFAEMPRRLALVANDLDAGRRVVFGRQDLAGVAVPRAVAASSAVPVLYAPVRIGERDYIAGGVGEVGHVDVAADMDCDLVLIVNAVVPVQTGGQVRVPTGHGPQRRIRDKGMLWVYNQSWRMVTQARLQKGLEAFRAEHPNVDVALLEPERDAASMFMYSPMNFAARRTILEEAYSTTLQQLRNPEFPARRALEARGLRFAGA
jgi:predicted acylesterase/phospholipase RssA